MNQEEAELRSISTRKPTTKAERSIVISVRVTAAESMWVDKLRAPLRMSRSTFVRLATLNKVPPAIPVINQEALALLANVARSVQRLADAMGTNATERSCVRDVANLAGEFRQIRTLLMDSHEQQSVSAKEQHEGWQSSEELW